MTTSSRFDDYVDLYDKYRLNYNNDVLNNVIKLIKSDIDISSIVDIGAGTGILTRQLLKYKFNNYYAIEPNKLMQDKSIKRDVSKKITHINDVSNKTNVKTSSIDIVFVGTAIHWFEPKKTLKEFKRILKKNGYLVILTSGYVGAIGEDLYILYQRYKKQRGKTKRYKAGLTNYSNQFYTIISRKPIKLSIDKFVGLELSMSTAPKQTDTHHQDYTQHLKKIFKKHSTNGILVMQQKTTALITNKFI